MSKRFVTSIFILSMFVVTLTWVPAIPMAINENSNTGGDQDSSPIPQENSVLTPDSNSDLEKHTIFNIADDVPADGILNPV
ncbi:MAG: hypothetical protein ACFFDM_13110, partial [Candidatus Thorarchaeota archaeon]